MRSPGTAPLRVVRRGVAVSTAQAYKSGRLRPGEATAKFFQLHATGES